jgi:hypothetical protein
MIIRVIRSAAIPGLAVVWAGPVANLATVLLYGGLVALLHMLGAAFPPNFLIVVIGFMADT